MSTKKKLARAPALLGLCVAAAMLTACAGQGSMGTSSSSSTGVSGTGTMGANRSDVRPDAARGPTGTPGGPTGPAGSGSR